MNSTLKRTVDGLSDVERLELLDYLRESGVGASEAAFDLSAAEKATLRARYEQLRADPSLRTYTIDEIAAELGVRL